MFTVLAYSDKIVIGTVILPGCQLKFVKKKKGFLKGSVFKKKKKKVFNARKKVLLLRAYLNKNSKK